jgi:hypothetical protein
MDLGEQEDGKGICVLQAIYFIPVTAINNWRIITLRTMSLTRRGHVEISQSKLF